MPTTYHRNRLLLAVATAIAAVIFWNVGRWFDFPRYEGFNVSLLAQPVWITSLLVVAIATLACVAICTIIAGSVRADAGLFCTALGLMALSLRGGPMRYTLFDGRGKVFVSLAIELVLLFAMVGVAWVVVKAMHSAGLSRRDDDDYTPDSITFDQKLLTTAIQAVATATLVLILCRTDQKVQTLAAVGVASMLGSLLAVVTSPTRPSVWYWTGPLVVGLVGYGWASIWGQQNLAIGQITGYLAALARPLPIDYASAGVAGSMLGYWFGRSWARDGEAGEPTVSTALDATAEGIIS